MILAAVLAAPGCFMDWSGAGADGGALDCAACVADPACAGTLRGALCARDGGPEAPPPDAGAGPEAHQDARQEAPPDAPPGDGGRPLGAACPTDTVCASGVCSQGRCCDQRCEGACCSCATGYLEALTGTDCGSTADACSSTTATCQAGVCVRETADAPDGTDCGTSCDDDVRPTGSPSSVYGCALTERRCAAGVCATTVTDCCAQRKCAAANAGTTRLSCWGHRTLGGVVSFRCFDVCMFDGPCDYTDCPSGTTCTGDAGAAMCM